MFNPQQQSDIEQIVRQMLATGITDKKVGDTPLEDYDLTNKKYVDANSGVSIYGRSHASGSTSVSGGYSAIKVTLAANDFVSGITWDAVNYRFTCLKAGTYLVCGSISFYNTTDGDPYVIMFYKNGSEVTECRQTAGGTSVLTMPNITDVMELNVGDYVELWAMSLPSSTVLSSAISTFLSIAKI